MKKKEDWKKEIRFMFLNPVLRIVHIRGDNTNEAWLLRNKTKGQNFLN